MMNFEDFIKEAVKKDTKKETEIIEEESYPVMIQVGISLEALELILKNSRG